MATAAIMRDVLCPGYLWVAVNHHSYGLHDFDRWVVMHNSTVCCGTFASGKSSGHRREICADELVAMSKAAYVRPVPDAAGI